MSAAPFITVREQTRETVKKSPARSGQRVRKSESVRVSAQTSTRRRVSTASSTFGLSTTEFVIAQCLSFTVLAVATFMMSVLLGNSMGEFERRKAVDATRKVRAAQVDIVRLRDRYDRLNNANEIGTWAMARGFSPAYGLSVRDGHVATD